MPKNKITKLSKTAVANAKTGPNMALAGLYMPPKPTAAPAKPTAAPAKPTAAPAKPTAAPAKPTAAPAKPTAARDPNLALIAALTAERDALKARLDKPKPADPKPADPKPIEPKPAGVIFATFAAAPPATLARYTAAWGEGWELYVGHFAPNPDADSADGQGYRPGIFATFIPSRSRVEAFGGSRKTAEQADTARAGTLMAFALLDPDTLQPSGNVDFYGPTAWLPIDGDAADTTDDTTDDDMA